MKTRAVVLRGISTARPYSETRPVEVEELELGAPREGEVLVRIAAAALCHSDLSVVGGDRVHPLPMALGHEAVGIVRETGPGVARVRPADHVAPVSVPSRGFCADRAAGPPALSAQAAAANGSGAPLHGPSLLTRRREREPTLLSLAVGAVAAALPARRAAALTPLRAVNDA
ncbi:alcohol dehydrogenase catalytic domain-containing protein [Streptomyces antimycoticus]